MPPKKRGARKIISAKTLQNGAESQMNPQNMIESSKTLEVEITNGKDLNGKEQIEEMNNNNLEVNTNLNKVVPAKRGRKKANASAENEVMSATFDVIPVVSNDEIESLDTQSQKSATTESITQDDNRSELFKNNDKPESNVEIEVLDDNKKVPLSRTLQKKVKEGVSDTLLQTKEKAPSKDEQRKAKLSAEEDKLSDLEKNDENSEEPCEKISEEQLPEEVKILSKHGQKKANPLKSDKKETEGSNNAVEEDKLFDQKKNEGPFEKISEEQFSVEEKIISKRGRKKANPLKPDKKEVKNSKDAMEEDKISDLKKIDENNEEIDDNNEPLEKVGKNNKEQEERLPAEKKMLPKRGRKRANLLNSNNTKIEDSNNDKPSDIISDEQLETGDKIKSRRGRKKAVVPSKSGETSDLKTMKEEVNENESSSNTKDLKNDGNVSSEEQRMPLRRGRRKVNEKETVGAYSKKESNEDVIVPSQDMITKKKPEKNIQVSKKNTRGAKDVKPEASSDVNDHSPVKRKRKNETAVEEIEKNKHGFNENKVLKVTLQRDDAIDKMCEEETKITEVGKAKNTKTGGKRAKEDEADSKDSEETSAKKAKKEPESKGQSKKDKMPDVTLLDFNNTSTSPAGKPWNLKISSWNVNGIRAWLQKDGLEYITHENPDVIALQETKCSDKMLPKEVNIAGYHAYWLAGDKDGYSGVGLLSKKEPVSVSYGIGVEEHDKEGRVVTAEYEEFYLVAAYVPNAGRGLVRLNYRMEWDKDFRSYIKNLDEKKPVVLCGDLNVAHEEIDLANPKTNKKNAGFTKEEREGFSTLLSEGFIDSFRHLYPDEKGAYTFWTYMMNARAKNVGWRLDYFVVSKKLTDQLCDNVIRKDVFGSDHCPITLFLCV